jgi:hypothetical protein
MNLRQQAQQNLGARLQKNILRGFSCVAAIQMGAS